MDRTNVSYSVVVGGPTFSERYYRDARGWLKISARGRAFRMTAEQVLNHLLPALAGGRPGVTVRVEHHGPDDPPTSFSEAFEAVLASAAPPDPSTARPPRGRTARGPRATHAP